MAKISSAWQSRWLLGLVFCLFAGCSFDGVSELSMMCETDNDCTGGRVCRDFVCQSPGSGQDLVDVELDTGGDEDVSVPLDSGRDVEEGEDVSDVSDVSDDVSEDVSDGGQDIGDDTGIEDDVSDGGPDVDDPDVDDPDVDDPDAETFDCEQIILTGPAAAYCQRHIVFVSKSGDDGNPGTIGAPVATLGQGIEKAQTDREILWVLVGAGTYEESIVLPDHGIGIVGGYSAQWDRMGDVRSVIRGESPTVQGTDVEAATLLAYLDIQVQDGQEGEDVVTVLLKNSPGVKLLGLDIAGGKAGAGADGAAGSAGQAGAPGGNGGAAPNYYRDVFLGYECSNQNQTDGPNGGSPGISQCAESHQGGGGGASALGNNAGTKGGDSSDYLAVDSGTLSGRGGNGGVQNSRNGLPGNAGKEGTDGADSPGGESAGSFVNGTWVGEAGIAGLKGENGGGGGGGGGGAGQSGWGGCNAWGGAGGGGGSGGCGGAGGEGGQPGGASVALMLIGSDIEIVDCSIYGGEGGQGGAGGVGGDGGQGGAGGAGGDRIKRATENSYTGYGGAGGKGGTGGAGGNGGGGAGGPSFVIVSDQMPSKVSNTTWTKGNGGAGGEPNGAAGLSEAIRVQGTGL